MVPAYGIIEIPAIQTEADSFQAYVTDETQSVGSSTWVLTPHFTILSNYA